MTTVSVPGKIHLMGEHAVVYGYPALLCAVNKRLRVSIEHGAPDETGIHVDSSVGVKHAQYAVRYLLDTLAIAHPTPARITISSDIPSGFHLGSSAAMAVGIAGAMLYHYKKIWNPIRINELAYEIEKKQHKNPSGGDNTAVTMGGFIWYRRELEVLKSIWQLPFKLHPTLSHFFLINTGRPKESTGDMVTRVASSVSTDADSLHKQFSMNEAQVRRITVAIKEGDEQTLIDAMKIGEKTLEHMGVVSASVLPCIREVEQIGGAVKILGGGGVENGVGFMLGYHPDHARVASMLSHYAYELTHITLGEEGVRLDEK